MFEKPPQDDMGNNSKEKFFDNNSEEKSYENSCAEFQERRDEKLKEFYGNIEDALKRQKAEFHSAVIDVFEDIFKRSGK